MIVESNSDIFGSGQKTLLCPANAAGAMGSGLAKEMRHRFPHYFFRAYRAQFPLTLEPADLERSRAHRLMCIGLPTKQQALIFCTKYHWKESADLALIDSNLELLARQWEYFGIESIALPPIGCGLGGLSYREEVRPLIEKHLSSFDVHVVGLSPRYTS